MIMEPLTIGGALAGSFLNKVKFRHAVCHFRNEPSHSILQHVCNVELKRRSQLTLGPDIHQICCTGASGVASGYLARVAVELHRTKYAREGYQGIQEGDGRHGRRCKVSARLVFTFMMMASILIFVMRILATSRADPHATSAPTAGLRVWCVQDQVIAAERATQPGTGLGGG